MASNDGVRVTSAVKQPEAAAPLVGAPAEYLDETGESPAPPREKTVPLKHPFKIGTTVYREVTVRRLAGKQLFAVNKTVRSGGDPEAAMFSAMLGIPVAAVEALDSEDIQTISKISANFTPQSASTADEPTGENGENT